MADVSSKWKKVDLLMRKLDCLAFGHDYAIWQQFTPHSRRIYCENCQQDWGMHDPTRTLVEWDGEIEAMYTTMGYTVRPRPHG